MLERLLAFCCLFVFNCQLYGKWAALGGSRGVQRGRGARLSPGAEGRTRCAFTPGKTTPLRLRWGELGRDPTVPFPANVRRGLAPPDGCQGAAGSRGRPGGPRGAAAPPAVYSPPEPGSGCRLPAGSAPRKPDAFAGFPDTPCKTGSEAIPRCRICKSLSFHLGKERGLRMGCVKYQNPVSAALQS